MLNKANTNKGWITAIYKNCPYRTFCFISKNKDKHLKDEIIDLLEKYNMINYKIIHVNNNDIFSFTICLEENKYVEFIDKLRNQSYSCNYNCLPFF